MGDQTAEVQTAIAVLGALHDLLDDLIAAELALLDGLVDPDNVLPDNATRADVEVSDLGVAHKALRQTDGQGRGLELGVASGALGELVHDRSVGSGDGIALLGRGLRGDTPAVNHDCTRSAGAP